MMLTLREAAAATRGELRNEERFPAELRIVTDTRTLRPGDTFLALRGERFDGHAFVPEAVARGAAAVVVEQPQGRNGGPMLIVQNTKHAFLQLAAAARARFTGKVIAVTGSTGKTTTKEFLAQLLSARYGSARVLASPANENNEIGVGKLLLSALPAHEVLVVEMGARHAGEIAQLVSIARPQAGILTNIGDAHLEIFGSRAALAETKWGLFSQGAQPVLNANDSESLARAPQLCVPPLWFGQGVPQRPGVWVTDPKTLLVQHGAYGQERTIDVPFAGAHNRENLAAAAAGALLMGADLDQIAPAIRTLTLPPGRYESIALKNGARLIFDAYNASASGTIATLDAFARESATRRIAVLGGMAELGSESARMHADVGAHAAELSIDVLLIGGENSVDVRRGAGQAEMPQERIVEYRSNAEAAAWLRAHLQRGDVALIKGSRKYAMEAIVEELRR